MRPQTFVYNSSAVLNAMALRLVGRQRYIWRSSALLDADNDEQVRFVIGHELGHMSPAISTSPGAICASPATSSPSSPPIPAAAN